MSNDHEKKIYEALSEPFPVEALKEDKSRWNARENKGIILTSIQPQWIKERLNNVLGIGGWEFGEKYENVERGIICHGTLIIRFAIDEGERTRRVQAVGGATIRDKGPVADPYKSAATDALSKCASYIGVGNDVFKGLVSAEGLNKTRGKYDVAMKAICATKKKDELVVLERMVADRKWEKDEVSKLQEAIKEQRSLEKMVANVS